MTSIPASRRARAMIFAPRSWPSRPGLATTTRIFFSGGTAIEKLECIGGWIGSERRSLGGGPEHPLQRLHHLALGRLRARRLEQQRHQVLVRVGGRPPERLECRLGARAVTAL